ncbi:MAG: hypothetical protein ACREK5_00080 [Gemmatimonadota bacterium]
MQVAIRRPLNGGGELEVRHGRHDGRQEFPRPGMDLAPGRLQEARMYERFENLSALPDAWILEEGEADLQGPPSLCNE